MYRRSFVLSLLFVSFGAVAQAKALASRESELYEKMMDILALTKAGVSFDDYSGQLPDLVVLYDRYERSGGTSLALMFARDNLLTAKSDWQRLLNTRARRTPYSRSNEEIATLEAKSERLEEESLKLNWQAAGDHLRNFIEQKAAKAKAQPEKPERKSK